MKTEQPIDGVPAPKLNRALRHCHEQQFNGKDWQGVAIDSWNELGSPDGEDVFNFLSSKCRLRQNGTMPCHPSPWIPALTCQQSFAVTNPRQRRNGKLSLTGTEMFVSGPFILILMGQGRYATNQTRANLSQSKLNSHACCTRIRL